MREWFKARNIWGGAFLALSDAEAGRLAKALWTYTMTGKQPNLSAAEKATFAMFQMTLDQDNEREADISSKRAAAGATGGKQKGARQAIAKFASASEAKQAIDDNQNQNQNKREIYDDDDDFSRTRDADDDKRGHAVEYAFFRSLARLPSPEEEETLVTVGRLLDFSPDMIAEAIRIAAANGARNIVGYTRTILNDWKQEAVTTPEEIAEYKFMYDAETGKNAYGTGDWEQMDKARARRKDKHAEETA